MHTCSSVPKVLLFLLLPILYVNAQINTPAGATMPFGQMIQTDPTPYSSGIIPANLPAGSYTPASNLFGKSQDAYTAYNTWKSTYAQNCGGGKWRILFDDNTSTVSEGIGYGMLIAAYAADKTLFDGLWAYYKANANGNGLMNWKIGGCTGAVGTNGATDGDLDAAMALIVAECQWPSYTSPYDYHAEATTLITAIKNYEIDPTSFQTINGDGWGFGSTSRNPSYFAPAYYKQFGTFVPSQSAFWTSTVNATYTFLNTNRNTTTGLVSDWATNTGAGTSTTYGYEACRNPWRMAVDAMWYGAGNSQTNFCIPIAATVNSIGAGSIGGSLNTNGTGGGTHNATFVSTFAAGIVGSNSTYQTIMNSMYTQTVSTVDASGYFGNTLRMLSLLVQTGNFWKPCGPFSTCQQPKLGADKTTCGSGFPVALTSGTTVISGTITYTWKKLPSTVVSTGTGASFKDYSVTSANGAGTYVVIRDSNSVCSLSDTIVISSTLPIPALGADQNICSPATYTLSPSNGASFPGATAWQWQLNTGSGFNNLANGTASSYSNARTAGTYRLTASIAGCTATSDDIILTSSLPTPVDGCAASAPIGISVVGSGTYQWYTAATGGSSVHSGSSYSAPSAGTYYVQDMSATSGSVGPVAPVNTTYTQWGWSSSNHMKITLSSNVTITSLKVPFSIYATTAGTIQVEVLDNSGNPLSTPQIFTSNATTPTCSSCNQDLTFTFSSFTINAAWGTNLRLRIVKPASGFLNGDPLWNAAGASYPYNSSPAGILSITGTAGGNGAANEYMYFHDIQFQTGTPCDRMPVVAATSGCILPVTWLGIYAARNADHQVRIDWSTAVEENNDHFVVQRSANGSEFENVGIIPGTGNSRSLKTYSIIDDQSLRGTSYYRVLQYDYDGKYSSSDLVMVGNAEGSTLIAKPNPFNEKTVLLFNSTYQGDVIISITNVQGTEIRKISARTNEEIAVGEGLTSGIYFVNAWDGISWQTIKIIKQ